MGLVTRDSMLGYMKADELKWCFSYIVKTCTAAGKIAGGFTRGGDPSSLLSHGFAMVALSHDLLDAMPTTVAGNAQAAVLAIAERAADLIRAGVN